MRKVMVQPKLKYHDAALALQNRKWRASDSRYQMIDQLYIAGLRRLMCQLTGIEAGEQERRKC